MRPRALHRLREAFATAKALCERGRRSKERVQPLTGLKRSAFHTVGFTHGYSNLSPLGISFFLSQRHWIVN